MGFFDDALTGAAERDAEQRRAEAERQQAAAVAASELRAACDLSLSLAAQAGPDLRRATEALRDLKPPVQGPSVHYARICQPIFVKRNQQSHKFKAGKLAGWRVDCALAVAQGLVPSTAASASDLKEAGNLTFMFNGDWPVHRGSGHGPALHTTWQRLSQEGIVIDRFDIGPSTTHWVTVRISAGPTAIASIYAIAEYLRDPDPSA